MKPFDFFKCQHIYKKLWFVKQFHPIPEYLEEKSKVYEKVHDQLVEVLTDPAIRVLVKSPHRHATVSKFEKFLCTGCHAAEDLIFKEEDMQDLFLVIQSRYTSEIIPGVVTVFKLTLEKGILDAQRHRYEILDLQ